MKKIILLAFVGLALYSCSPKTDADSADVTDAKQLEAAEGDAYAINYMRSSVNWIGAKPGGEHHGTVKAFGGNIMVKENKVVGGTIVFDLTTIENLDLEDEGMRNKLVNHLKSADFFDVEKYPKATFEITEVIPIEGQAADDSDIIPTHQITGNLTIKDITKSVSFKALVAVETDKLAVKAPNFSINRTEWQITFKSKSVFSELKDNFINDEIIFNLDITAAK